MGDDHECDHETTGIRVRLDVHCADANVAAEVVARLSAVGLGFALEGMVSGMIVAREHAFEPDEFTIDLPDDEA